MYCVPIPANARKQGLTRQEIVALMGWEKEFSENKSNLSFLTSAIDLKTNI